MLEGKSTIGKRSIIVAQEDRENTSKEMIFLFIYILMGLTRQDLGYVVLINYIRLSQLFTSLYDGEKGKKKGVCSSEREKKEQLNNCVTSNIRGWYSN